MIKIKIKGPNTLPETHNKIEKDYPTDRRCLWIGRGEEINDKENQQSYSLNLGQLSQSVSRIHACLFFSPIFRINQSSYPTYYKKLHPKWSQLPSHLHFLIWEYARPTRKLLLKDMHSKTGIYKKVTKTSIYLGMQIVLGDSRPILFHHQEIHDTKEEMNIRVNDLKNKGYVVLNESGNYQARSFWIVSLKQQYYILKNYPTKIYIGRSSNCQLSICQASISRRHATLQYAQGQWTISDGNGSTPSSNGVWQRTKKYQINCQNKNYISETLKIADMLFIIQMRQDFTSLNLTELYLSYKNSSNTSFSQIMKIQNEATLITKDSGTV